MIRRPPRSTLFPYTRSSDLNLGLTSAEVLAAIRAQNLQIAGGQIAEPPIADRAFQPNLVFTGDRKSTRLNSSHSQISYAVFCLKKKNTSQDAADTAL